MSKLNALFGHGQHEITLLPKRGVVGDVTIGLIMFVAIYLHSLLFIVVNVLIMVCYVFASCRSSPIDRVVRS